MNPNQQNQITMKNPMLAAGQARGVVCNRFVSMWHQWRANTLTLKLQVQTERCNLLQIAEREYASSYYTDRLHDAVCRRIEIAGALEYHKSKLPHANIRNLPRDEPGPAS